MAALAELGPREAAERLLDEHGDAWVSRLAEELDQRLSGRRLERVMRLWGLSRTELGDLFGVSRQAVTKWIANGVPSDRVPTVADVEAITDLLDRYLKRERIAAVVRRAAPRLGGTSILELVGSGRSSEALRLTRQMFTFGDAHA